MIGCPVCEHQQAAGSECEVCGRPLVEGRGTDAPVAPLEGLELTFHLDVSRPAPEPMPELEPTRLAGGEGAPALEPLELEPTRTAPVEVVVEAVPDLERIEPDAAGDGPTPLALVVVCRYCRSEALPGELRCGRCGMRLPVTAGPAEASLLAEPLRCSCGAPVKGPRCPACGARTPGA